MDKNEIPRRSRLDLMTDAEKAIQHAVDELEKVGAHERLTNIGRKLLYAKDELSDFIDGIPAKTTATPKCDLGFYWNGSECVKDAGKK